MLIGVVLLVGIVFGLFAVVTVPIEMSRMAQAEHWPSRKAVITHSYTRHVRGSATRPRTNSSWKVEICGVYEDDGGKFCLSRVRYGDIRLGADKNGALEMVAKYPLGREVEVYYSPDNPKETILEPHAPWNKMIILLSAGIGFLLLPFFLWVFRKKIEPERYGRA
jgi:hypothetical protein